MLSFLLTDYGLLYLPYFHASEPTRTTVVDTPYRGGQGIMLDVVDTPYRGGVLC